jgi:hypothetical protein
LTSVLGILDDTGGEGHLANTDILVKDIGRTDPGVEVWDSVDAATKIAENPATNKCSYGIVFPGYTNGS